MGDLKTPFRYDFVGSFLRPERLKEATEKFRKGEISEAELKVVLGLITTKTPELEDREVIKKRIAQAAKIIPLDRLCLSPQCGFASCAIGNKLTEEQQSAKLKLVKEIAEEVWG